MRSRGSATAGFARFRSPLNFNVMRLEDTQIEAQVISPLRLTLGQSISGVHYGLFPHELESIRSDGQGPLELDAEVRLSFTEGIQLFFSWSQAPGWSDINSLAVSTSSFLKPGAVTYVDAHRFECWTNCMGSQLISIDVLGWQDTPAIARLRFERSSLLVGVGYAQGFRDADSIIVRPDERMWLHTGSEADLLWSSLSADA